MFRSSTALFIKRCVRPCVCADVQYLALREDLESDARDFEAPTWSLAVDQQYLKNFSKDAVRRQDVIHGE